MSSKRNSGETNFSIFFNIERGVVQDNIVSPVLFILTLDTLIQYYDKSVAGIKCNGKLTIRVLGYAELIEETIEYMTSRLTVLANTSMQETDIILVRMDKTLPIAYKNKEKYKQTNSILC